MRLRAEELEARPRAVADARGFLDLARKTANAWPTIKPWLNATDIEALLGTVGSHTQLCLIASAHDWSIFLPLMLKRTAEQGPCLTAKLVSR
jgi:hypothetical protein